MLSPNRVAYLDLTGSGVETIAHVRENGRITLMTCAFNGNPNISRIYGVGTVHEVGSEGFDELAPEFTVFPGSRAIIEIDVDQVTESCGYAVPLMRFEGARDRLSTWAVANGDKLDGYRTRKNATSIDGLPGWPL